MTVDHFGYLTQASHHLIKLCRIIQNESDIGTCLISNSRRIDFCTKSENNTCRSKFLYALMYGCSGNMSLTRNLKEWFARIVGEHFKDFNIQ